MTTTAPSVGCHVVMVVQNLGVPKDRRVWREATTLTGAGHLVTVIAPAGPGEPAREQVDGVDIHRYRRGPELGGAAGHVLEVLVGFLGTAWQLLRLRLTARIDVLHTANPPDTTVLLAIALRPTGIRFVYDQHDLCPELIDLRSAQARGLSAIAMRALTPVVRALESLSYRSADLVIAPNNSYRQVATGRGRVPAKHVVTVRSGPDAVHVRADVPRGLPLRVAFAGVMGRQDRVDVLLEAVAVLLERRPGVVEVDLIGEGDDIPRLRRLADELGIGDVVSWPGWLRGDDLVDRLRTADVGVSLDDDNPFCQLSTMTKVPEYLAFGLPCVIADLRENRETAGRAARYFEPGNPIELAKQLEELVDDDALRSQLAAAAAARAPALLWAASARRLIGAYDMMLHGGPPISGDQVLAA